MEHFLERYAPYLSALMRIIVGLLFACHGAQKRFGVLGGFRGQPGVTTPLDSLMSLGSIIEFGGGLYERKFTEKGMGVGIVNADCR